MSRETGLEKYDWFKVLNAFYEENLAFEYTGSHEVTENWKPDRPELEDVNFSLTVQKLKKGGYLEVETVEEPDPEAPAQLTVIRLSEKGLETVFERDKRQLRKEHQEEMFDQQSEFEEKQITRQNEVNAAIGYLTLGLLIVTALELIVSAVESSKVNEFYIPLIATAGIFATVTIAYRIYKLGLLDPRSSESVN